MEWNCQMFLNQVVQTYVMTGFMLLFIFEIHLRETHMNVKEQKTADLYKIKTNQELITFLVQV
jgi:hypothetical protein